MKKGFFLGINDSVGDKFSFYIVSTKQVKLPRPRVDIRSVVRLRDTSDDNNLQIYCDDDGDILSFYKLDNDGNQIPLSDSGEENVLETEPIDSPVTSLDNIPSELEEVSEEQSSSYPINSNRNRVFAELHCL